MVCSEETSRVQQDVWFRWILSYWIGTRRHSQTKVEAPDAQAADVSTQGIGSTADVSSPGRRISKFLRTSPSSGQKSKKKNQKKSTSSAAPGTPTVRAEADSIVGDDDSEEQFSRLWPHTIKLSRSIEPIIRIMGPTFVHSTTIVRSISYIVQGVAVETQVAAMFLKKFHHMLMLLL